MGHLREMDLGADFQPFAVLREQFGFVPSMFRAQTLLPTIIEAEVGLVDAVLFKERALSRIQKECLLLVLAAANGSAACGAIQQWATLSAASLAPPCGTIPLASVSFLSTLLALVT